MSFEEGIIPITFLDFALVISNSLTLANFNPIQTPSVLINLINSIDGAYDMLAISLA